MAPGRTKAAIRRFWPFALLVLLVAGAFWRAPLLGWVGFDDSQYVTENPLVLQGLSLEAVRRALASTHASNWHPLTWISHQLDVSLFGTEPGGHHVVNVLLHLISALLLLAFFRAATRARFSSVWPAFFVAAIFAVHPLRVESVAWVAERKDVLSGVFWMLCMLLHLHYARSPGFWRYLLLFVCMAAGLTAKPMLVTLPVALLLLDYWPLGRFRWAPEGCAPRDSLWRIVLEKAPLFGLAAASSWITMIAQKEALGSWEALPLVIRAANAAQSYILYLKQLFWPSGLVPYYPHPGHDISYTFSVVCAVILACLTVGVLVLRKRAPWLLTGWLWHLATLVPVIGLVQVGGQSMADRYTYIPNIGLLAALVYSAAALLQRFDSRQLKGLMAAVGFCALLALVWSTQALSWHWRDGEALFTRAVKIAPSDLAHNNLANVYGRRGEERKALKHFIRAMELNPINYIATYNAGRLHYSLRNMSQARYLLHSALRINPNIYQAHETLGLISSREGKHRMAAAHLNKALQLAPASRQPQLLNDLGIELARSGDQARAREAFMRALQLAPGHGPARANLEQLSKMKK